MLSAKNMIQHWVELFNKADVDALADCYHEDAVNHQVPNEPVNGKQQIKAMFRAEFSQANMTCIPVNIFEDGEWGILEWTDPKGMRGCGFFHVVDGKIKTQRGYWDKLSFLKLYGLPIPIS